MSKTVLLMQGVDVFQNNQKILSNVNLQVNKGEFLYVIGKTGAGKSSFMKILYGDLPLSNGHASIVGYDLAKLKQKDIPYLRRSLGIVFQDFKLLPERTIYGNLHFALKATGWREKEAIDRKIEEVLDKVGMLKHIQKMPHQLSGGEQQRIAIARALLNDPDVILADEPTGNLDPQTSSEVMDLLKEINQSGRTIIMITHDYALLLKYPYKTLKCDEGTLFEVVYKTS